MSKFDLPSHANPCCGYVTDAAGSELEITKPEMGDLTICLNCGAILVYTDPHKNLMRHASRIEVERLPTDMQRRIVIAQIHIRDRGWLKKESKRVEDN